MSENSSNPKDIIIRKCELTALNYGNLANRLQKRKTMFQALLPYYSIVGITNAILSKYFINISPYKLTLLSFWGILISITFLVISLQISLARYPERIDSATKNLNQLKILKGQAKCLQDSQVDEISSISESYNNIISNGILVGRRYFYATCKDIDRNSSFDSGGNNNIAHSEVKKYFSNLEQNYIKFTNFLEELLYIILFILPVIVYVIILAVLPSNSTLVL